MDNIKITLENGVQADVKGLFYIFNSKYYFIYTQGEKVDQDYIHLYVVQVCKEVVNTTEGPKDTGYMLGIETSNPDEWALVQTSITKIIESKKNNVASQEIQYLPFSMLTNLKIVSKNKFKLMSRVLKEIFNLDFETATPVVTPAPAPLTTPTVAPAAPLESLPVDPLPINKVPTSTVNTESDVIIDYRAKFFEEQDKNKELEQRIKELEQKMDSIKQILN